MFKNLSSFISNQNFLVQSITSIDDKNRLLEIWMELYTNWIDSRIGLKPQMKHESQDKIPIVKDKESIFMPDFFIYNATEQKTTKIFDKTSETVDFYPNKTVR